MSFFHRVNKHRLNVNLSFIFLFSLHRVIHPATSMKTPQNTTNQILIVKKILVLFSIALITFIHSSDVDIDLESFSFLFESKDIMNILLTSLFSVRPVSYGTAFFPHAWHLGHCPSGKKFGPCLKVRPSNPVSEKKGENSKVERVISSKCVVRVHEGQLCAQE